MFEKFIEKILDFVVGKQHRCTTCEGTGKYFTDMHLYYGTSGSSCPKCFGYGYKYKRLKKEEQND